MARGAIPALTAVTKDSDPEVRLAAAKALWQIDGRVEPLVTIAATSVDRDLNEIMTSEALWQLSFSFGFDQVRFFGLRTPAGLSPRAYATVTELIRLLKHRQGSVRLVAVFLLTHFDPDREPRIVPALIDKLDDLDFRVQWWALTSLGNVGPKAHAAVPALREIRDNTRFRVKAGTLLVGQSAFVTPMLPFQALGTIQLDALTRELAVKALEQVEPTEEVAATK
jgi:HEAT repeat protein